VQQHRGIILPVRKRKGIASSILMFKSAKKERNKVVVTVTHINKSLKLVKVIAATQQQQETPLSGDHKMWRKWSPQKTAKKRKAK
jgi:hypothetical protein